MIFKSNLEAPDLAPHFRLLSTPRPWSQGHDVPSHPELEPDCGYWTHDEAAILYNVALQVGGSWVDIGSRFGWTAAHLMAAGCSVTGVDPCYLDETHIDAMREGIESVRRAVIGRPSTFFAYPGTAGDFFRGIDSELRFDGFVIDGNHDAPEPLRDAVGCSNHAKQDAVILLHDFYGKPIRDAVRFLIADGWKCRVYWTPNGVALCWRGLTDVDVPRGREKFMPPYHVPDLVFRRFEASMPDFERDFTAWL